MILRPLRTAALLVLAMGALAIACSDDSTNGGSTNGPSGPAATDYAPATDAPTATAAEGAAGNGRSLGTMEALALSTERSAEAESFRGEFTMEFGGGFEMSGEYEFEAPDRLHMVMSVLGQEIELLMLPPDLFMTFPGLGWYGGSADELGVDYEAFARYASDRGPIDVEDFLGTLGDASQLPGETIDGVRYLRYHAQVDLADAAAGLPEELVDPETFAAFGDVPPVDVNVWLDADTYLPYRIDIALEMGPPADDQPFSLDMNMKLSMLITDYNEAVHIPDPPADYEPISGIDDLPEGP